MNISSHKTTKQGKIYIIATPITKMENIELDIVIVPEDLNGSVIYSIYSLQFPNVVTQGKTVEEAKEMLKEALELYFEEMPEAKNLAIKIESQEKPLISKMSI
jgi:predicted RNase H-like HicB family nuclease